MKCITTSLLTMLLSSVTVTASAGFFDSVNGALSKVGDAVKESVERTTKKGKSSKTTFESGLKGTLLDDLFIDIPYDTNIKGDKQWPRVALTVIDEPSFHTRQIPTNTNNIKSGCWKLSAVIWQNQNNSKKVEPFEWCTPDHVVYGVAMSGASGWFSWSADLSYDKTTGPKRTNGPLSPSKPFPSDVRHKRHLKNQYVSADHYDGLMLISILYQMGLDWSVVQDKRVWVAKFENAYK